MSSGGIETPSVGGATVIVSVKLVSWKRKYKNNNTHTHIYTHTHTYIPLTNRIIESQSSEHGPSIISRHTEHKSSIKHKILNSHMNSENSARVLTIGEVIARF